ncbi:MAG TPA: hypothetical protein VI306_01915 [Pyrinomonadaceae bacterium]
MTKQIVYNIPATLIDSYRSRAVILRSSSPQELLYSLWRADPLEVRFIQLLSPLTDTSVLEGSLENIPIEIVLEDPGEYECLYDFANLVDSHPLRIAIPVVKGFSKAVKLAVSLDYAVKLQVEQPDEFLLLELEAVLDAYLHRSYVRQPIEFFHSLLSSFYREEPSSLWEILEEDPTQLCYVTDDGRETISRRFVGLPQGANLPEFVNRLARQLLAEKTECYNCEFFDRCQGYFKWPDKNYDCEGVKRLLRGLLTATQDVRRDLSNFQTAGVHAQS